MAIDMAARLKELREKKAAEAQAKQSQENKNAEVKAEEVSVPVQAVETVSVQTDTPFSTVTSTTTIGTSKTSEIDHLAFMTSLQELETAIHTQHPKMPVLLMMIHKHLRTDPELVTTLSEDEIGVIVTGLKLQTKTELAGTVLKQPKSKKTTLSTDMF